MQKIIDILAIILLLGAIINASFYYTYFWQLKEYRFDRMKDFLSTPSGKARMFNIFLLVKLLLLAFLLLGLLLGTVRQTLVFGLSWQELVYNIVLLLSLVEIGNAFWRMLQHHLYRPEKTVKGVLIVFLTILICLAWPIYLLMIASLTGYFFLALAWMSLLAPLINVLIIALFYPLTLFSKALVLSRARRKIAQAQGLRIIGITGSYGKSTTKEFLAHILEKKFRVLKTPGNTNTEIGVAQIILRHLKPEHEVFIVEAGAYKKGEIKKICRMVAPRMAVITAVKDSHLALFGSLEQIKQTKFELIESLPSFGTAFFNTGNEGAHDLSKRAKTLELAKIITYSAVGEADLQATDMQESSDGLQFKVKGVHFSTAVPGRHNVSNILGALAVGLELGMTLQEMAEEVKTLKLREHTLSVLHPSGDLTIIDDTYNANPDGVMAALDYLNTYRDKQKIMVFPGMQELGAKSAAEHRRIAKRIAEVCDYAYFTSLDFARPLKEALREKNFSDYLFINQDQKKLLRLLRDRLASRPGALLLISRGSEQVLKKLTNAP